MNKLYRTFILCLSMTLIFFMTTVQAQTIGDIVWEDHFDDPANDYLLNNVGWMYFGEEDDLIGQEVSQTAEETAWIKSGVFSTVVGASIIQTNGVNYIDPEDFDGSVDRIKIQNANIPANHDITLQVNFKKITNVEGGQFDPIGTFFLLGTRMFNPDTGRGYGDPIEDSTYVLWIAPLIDQVNIAKFSGELAILDPTGWTYFAEAANFDFDLNVPYWIEFYLYEGDLKVKIWEGDLADGDEEPWLMEVTDPEPRVRGNFTELGLLGDPVKDGDTPDGDEIEIDDVVMREITSADAIEHELGAFTPTEFALNENYPNPFNPETTIEFSLDKTDDVTLKIYSITGQLVRTLANGTMEVGVHKVRFNGRDDLGNLLSSGVYFYQLQSAGQIATNKMILMK